ncbi:MAG: hypothetical protein WDO69_19585 [Pseudomonadota bacterium]
MRVRDFLRWPVLALVLAAPVDARAQPPAVWYRASEACPSGAQFLNKLAESSRQARLAQAGDHIDFVVTLVATDRETVGRLERQTDSGSVAIRELRDATCEQVADALALSLGLALAPEQSTAEPLVEKSANDPGALVDVAPSATPETTPSPATPPPAAAAAAAHSPAPTIPLEDPPSSRPRWSVGLELGPMIGISTQPLPRGQLFIDLKPAPVPFLPNLSLRAGVVASVGSSDAAIGAVRRWILAGRAEACPIAWFAGRFDLRPCVAFELGATGASSDGETGLSESAIWAAPGAQLRFSVALQPKWVWLEMSGGVLVPLTRSEVFAGSQSLYRDAPAVFHGALGISVRLP